jgi:hypothetical protein
MHCQNTENTVKYRLQYEVRLSEIVRLINRGVLKVHFNVIVIQIIDLKPAPFHALCRLVVHHDDHHKSYFIFTPTRLVAPSKLLQ